MVNVSPTEYESSDAVNPM